MNLIPPMPAAPPNVETTPSDPSDSRLAVEVAIQIRPVDEILSTYGITAEQLKVKLKNPVFRKMVVEAKRTWESDLSVKERIRLKASHLVEDAILVIYGILQDGHTAASARLDAFKSLARVADLEPSSGKNAGQSIGEKFMININLGDGQAHSLSFDARKEALEAGE